MYVKKQHVESFILTPGVSLTSLIMFRRQSAGFYYLISAHCRPNGRLDITVEVPDEPMTWVLGGFGISRELGFGIIHNQPRVNWTHLCRRSDVTLTLVNILRHIYSQWVCCNVTTFSAHFQHESTRMFFMRSEVPDTVVRGEQIGVRLALFNLWEDYLEVSLILTVVKT